MYSKAAPTVHDKIIPICTAYSTGAGSFKISARPMSATQTCDRKTPSVVFAPDGEFWAAVLVQWWTPCCDARQNYGRIIVG